ncbi:MAG: hypothetical protein L0Z48_01845 [candidate division Zixibacteria bacterium]|nr:hypothetical protein [candidate division Zixibacteria bacterium]MCI0595266.1 hypothetical protein [candidate division Zixibacteria bacterium]
MSDRQVVVLVLVVAGVAVFSYWLGSRQGAKQVDALLDNFQKVVANLQQPNQPVTVKSHEVKVALPGLGSYAFKKIKTT